MPWTGADAGVRFLAGAHGTRLSIPILIHLERNAMVLPDGGIVCFSQRWEATLLAMLYTQAHANCDLPAAMLRTELARRGQVQPLNRAQHGRLIKSLAEGLARIPGHPVLLEYGPRKATVGPWRLQFKAACEFEIGKENHFAPASAGASQVPPAERDGTGDAEMETAWPWPRMLAQPSPDPDLLHGMLSVCLVSDGFALQGNYHSALETMQQVYAHPLSGDARVMLTLREALHYKRLGEFPEARALALKVMKTDGVSLRDPALRHHAGFLLDRIDYDESPGTAHARLWQMAGEPSPVMGIDLRTAPDWHNLRALLARRHLLGMADEQGGREADTDLRNLHRHALLHLETAIYCALALRDWEKLQAFVANVAFHLQCVMPLGLSSTGQVLAWYTLMMNYAEKFDAGKDSAWEYIFLGKFWLDHEEELLHLRLQSPAAGDPFFIIQNLHPAHEDFYLHAIERLHHCGDPRQVAIAWINYLRFAKKHLGKKIQFAAEKNLCGLLFATPPLKKQLEAEGYGLYLPSC